MLHFSGVFILLFVSAAVSSSSSPYSFGVVTTTTASSSKDAENEIDLGTTLVAIKYKHGVVLGADSQTSISSYVANRFAHKIVPITNNCLVCRSGSAADTQHIADDARLQFLDRKYRYGLHNPSVSQVAHYIKSKVYGDSNSQQYSASLLVAGYDKNDGRARIFSILPSGALLEEDDGTSFAVGGSGSSYILGYLDDNINKKRKNTELGENDAIALCAHALYLAIQRDGSSGGITRIFICNKDGIRQRDIYPETSSNDDSNKGSSSDKQNPLEGFAEPIQYK